MYGNIEFNMSFGKCKDFRHSTKVVYDSAIDWNGNCIGYGKYMNCRNKWNSRIFMNSMNKLYSMNKLNKLNSMNSMNSVILKLKSKITKIPNKYPGLYLMVLYLINFLRINFLYMIYKNSIRKLNHEANMKLRYDFSVLFSH